MKIRVLSNSSGPLGPHAACVHEVSLVHARCVRSQGSWPMSCAIAANFHSQWRAAGSWKPGGECGECTLTTRTQRHQEILVLAESEVESSSSAQSRRCGSGKNRRHPVVAEPAQAAEGEGIAGIED